MTLSTPRSRAEQLDAHDELAALRAQFHIPQHAGRDCIYLCGHSLGLAPKRAAGLVNEELRIWQTLAVEGHFAAARPWVSYHEQVTRGLAALAGAETGEVVAMNSLTVNLHLLYADTPSPQRYKRRCFRSETALCE